MKKQVLVIGLGQFGMSLVRALARLRVEVIAVDNSKDKIRAVSDIADSVACIDATDEAALASLAPDRRDVCICAIGDEAREASIICTALLRQLGAKRVLARASDALHARILGLIGAHDVVNPESVVGQRIATRVTYESILEEFPLGDGLVITEVIAPSTFSGRTLAELSLPRKLQVIVVAIRRGDQLVLPRADVAVAASDVLVLVSRPGAVVELMERIG